MQSIGMLKDGSELQRDVSEVQGVLPLADHQMGNRDFGQQFRHRGGHQQGEGPQENFAGGLDLVEQSLATPQKSEDTGAAAPKKRGKKR